jgi:hypothetical protein
LCYKTKIRVQMCSKNFKHVFFNFYFLKKSIATNYSLFNVFFTFQWNIVFFKCWQPCLAMLCNHDVISLTLETCYFSTLFAPCYLRHRYLNLAPLYTIQNCPNHLWHQDVISHFVLPPTYFQAHALNKYN